MKITNVGKNSTAIRNVFDTNKPSVTVDSGTLPELQPNKNIEVPENRFQVNDTTLEEINQVMNPFTEDGNHGIISFVNFVNFLKH